jgi:hypothetical protein
VYARHENRRHPHTNCRYLPPSSTVLASVNKSQFDFTSLSPRALIPPGLDAGSGIVQSVQSEAPSITTAAFSVISDAQTVVSSAITAIQTDLDSVIPRNCTLGTRYFCLGYVNNVTCSGLPLNVSDLLSRAMPASSNYQLSSLESLDQELKRVSSGTIEGPFILGIISTVILITVIQYVFWKESMFANLFWGLPLETAFGGVGNSVCIVSFICPTIILWVLYSKTEHLPFNITLERGKLMSNCVASLCCTVAMTFCMVSMFLRKYILRQNI